MRWVKRLGLAVVILGVISVGALFVIPSDKIARIVETQFVEKTGRKLSLNGDISPTIYPRLGVSLELAEISNTDWSQNGPMVQAERLDIGVGLLALLRGEIVVETFVIDNPVIRLERGKDGVANWDFLTDMGGEDNGEGPTPVSIPKAVINGGIVEFIDHEAGQTHKLDNLDVTFSLPEFDGEARIDLTAHMQGQPFGISGSIKGAQQLLEGGQQGLELAFKAGDTKADFSGEIEVDPTRIEGIIKADIADQPALFALLGQTPPAIPPGLGQRTKVQGALTLTPDSEVFLRDAVINLDQNRLTGDIDIALEDTPRITARLTGDSLDFSAMSTDTTQEDGAANVESGGWSDATLDVTGLSAVNGDFTFRANAVDFGSVRLGATDIKGTLDRGRLVMDLTQVRVFDGNVTGQFVVNGRNGLSVGGDMLGTGVAMQQVLSDFAGYDRLRGRADMPLKFLGVGTSMNAIMNSLSGAGALNIGQGEVLGLDFVGMARNRDTAYRGGAKTVFDAITGTFTIQDGVLRNNDLAMQAKRMTATGKGLLDIGGQSIEYRVVPVALSDENSDGVRVPVLIEGPWSDIKFRPDLKALVDPKVEAEKEKLRQQAAAKEVELKAKADEKARALEDAARQKLEDVTKDGLGKLLGRN